MSTNRASEAALRALLAAHQNAVAMSEACIQRALEYRHAGLRHEEAAAERMAEDYIVSALKLEEKLDGQLLAD